MILYQSDIDQQNPHFQINTRNASFVRMTMVLRRMGVKNHLFPLTLYQPELEKVDPFDYAHLDNNTIAKILIEAKLNPWYFYREIIQIPSAGGGTIPFELHRGNLAAIWTFFNDIDFGLIQPRQTGKTYVTQSIMAYVMFVGGDNVKIGMFTKDATLSAENVARLKELRDGLPKYFVQKDFKEWDRKEAVSNVKRKNYYLTFASANDERQAYKLGRGATMSYLHFDEIAFMSYNWIVVPTATNAMIKASEQTRAAGMPSPVIYTTTAGNPDTKEGAYALSIFEAAAPFSETMYDLKDRNELLEVIARSSTRKMLFLEFSYRQLGKTDEWFQEVAARSNSSQDDINRDLLNMWQSSTDKAIIPRDLLAKMRASQRDPAHTDLADGFIVRWYADRAIVKSEDFAKRPMIMGMDTSENVGRDFTTFTIIDPTDMSVLATCRCNESNTMQVAKHVVTLLQRYPRLVWIPERNNTGTGIIDFVMEQLQKMNINPFSRIFNEVVQNYEDPKYKNVNIYNYQEIYGKTRAAFGFRTSGAVGSGTSRNALYKVTMMKALEMNHSKLYDRSLISEFCNLTERNGRIDHPVGLHDDTVISYLLSCFLVYFGKNLRMYGIMEDEVLSEVVVGNGITKDIQNQQVAIRRRIRELEELLARNPIHLIRQSYLRELSTLKPMLNDDAVQIEPLAVAQVERQEKELEQTPRKATVEGLRSFQARWGRKPW